MDLSSLQLQRYCAISVTEGGWKNEISRLLALLLCDLDLDPMTLICELELNILKM